MNVFTIIKFWLFHYCLIRRTAWQVNAIHLQGGFLMCHYNASVFSLGHTLFFLIFKLEVADHFHIE